MIELRHPLGLYLAAYVISLSGSIFGAVAIFLSLEETFGSIEHLSFALALKTLLSGLLSPALVGAMRRFGLWTVLIAAQLFGAAVSLILIPAFELVSYPLALLLIVLGGLPNSAIAIANPVLFRSALADDSFRRLQGRLGLISSGTLLVAGLISQFLLLRFGLTALLIYDAFTFLVAFFAFRLAAKSGPYRDTSQSLPSPDPIWTVYRKSLASNGAVGIYLLIASIYLFKGIFPLISGSSNATFASLLTDSIRKSIWSLEALSGIFGSLLYIRLAKGGFSSPLIIAGGLSSLAILPYLVINRPVVLIGGLFVLGLLMHFGFQHARDTFLLGAPDRSTLEERSATVLAASNFMMTLSPVILAASMKLDNLTHFVGFTLCLQLLLIGIYLLIVRRRL